MRTVSSRVTAAVRLVAEAGEAPFVRITVVNGDDRPLEILSVHCANEPVRAMAAHRARGAMNTAPIEAPPGRLPLTIAAGTESSIDLPLHATVPWRTCKAFHLVVAGGGVLWVDRRLVRRFRHELLAGDGVQVPQPRRAYAPKRPSIQLSVPTVLQAVQSAKAVFDAAHVEGMAALRRGDYDGFGAAIEQERQALGALAVAPTDEKP